MNRLFFCALLSLLSTGMHGQSASIQTARKYYAEKDFYHAGILFDQLFNKVKKDKSDLLMASKCFYESNQLDRALEGFNLLSQSKKYRKVSYQYLAKIHQYQRNFRQAIFYYKRHLSLLDRDNPERPQIYAQINHCIHGITINKKEPLAVVESIGPEINTHEDEFAAFPSVNYPGKYYFSAVKDNNEGGKRNAEGAMDKKEGHYRADLFVIEEARGNWSSMKDLNPLLNSSKHDVILDFARHGEVMIFFQGWDEIKGTASVDTFTGSNRKYKFSKFESIFNPEIGDNSLCIFQDSIMIFSSARMGGFGGYDLYLSVRRKDQWSQAYNLGPNINTFYNETTPFLANDGMTLYFASNNSGTMGGYDIYRTRFGAEEGKWQEPKNLGVPINSAGDDLHFKLTADGIAGVFTSDRKEDNQGKRDIYIAYFKDDLQEQYYPPNGSVVTQLIQFAEPVRKSKQLPSNEEITSRSLPVKIEISLEALSDQGDDFLKDERNHLNLSKIVELMQKYPELRLRITGHAYEDSPEALNLYFSMKKARQVQEYLLSKGISQKRMEVRAAGRSFPIVKTQINGIPYPASQKANKRIDLQLLETEETDLHISYPNPGFNESLLAGNEESRERFDKGLFYAILLGESTQVLNHPYFQSGKALFFAERNPGNEKISYYCGLFKNFQEAKNFLNQNEGEKNNSIRAFVNGKKLERNELINYVQQYDDLILLINEYNKNQ
ncbi:MAG: OmpA family protein [Saprospiraceae bacterium]|nr:OmpA family protein [Candidatus Vicinibacter affinis]